ncbi:MAG: nickel transporter [Planctomycetes bacterium]|nr:nickel transporter [Planctomycetota bacterium]
MPLPRLIPVLDVMNGHVVRAVAGRRDHYKPVESKLTVSAHPINVALALLDRTGAHELYVADLDAIRGGSAVSSAVARLVRELNCAVWLDAGIGPHRPPAILPVGANVRPVVALETAAPADADARGAVSLDLKAGQLLGRWADWGAAHDRDALAVARTAITAGAKTLIVLDLARVGTGSGTGTEELLRAIRATWPEVDLLAGGGVRTWADVERLGEAGATGVLVASALHDGTLSG